MDGQRVARPWARLLVDLDSPPATSVESLETTLHEIGTQGVRPLSAAELSIYDSREAVERGLAAATRTGNLPDKANADLVRRFYRAWLRDNAVVAPWVVRQHRAFSRWL
jgi:hypothetical protein